MKANSVLHWIGLNEWEKASKEWSLCSVNDKWYKSASSNVRTEMRVYAKWRRHRWVLNEVRAILKGTNKREKWGVDDDGKGNVCHIHSSLKWFGSSLFTRRQHVTRGDRVLVWTRAKWKSHAEHGTRAYCWFNQFFCALFRVCLLLLLFEIHANLFIRCVLSWIARGSHDQMTMIRCVRVSSVLTAHPYVCRCGRIKSKQTEVAHSRGCVATCFHRQRCRSVRRVKS